jgi:hypothetical protein
MPTVDVSLPLLECLLRSKMLKSYGEIICDIFTFSLHITDNAPYAKQFLDVTYDLKHKNGLKQEKRVS